jgi:hypothetical protein
MFVEEVYRQDARHAGIIDELLGGYKRFGRSLRLLFPRLEFVRVSVKHIVRDDRHIVVPLGVTNRENMANAIFQFANRGDV